MIVHHLVNKAFRLIVLAQDVILSNQGQVQLLQHICIFAEALAISKAYLVELKLFSKITGEIFSYSNKIEQEYNFFNLNLFSLLGINWDNVLAPLGNSNEPNLNLVDKFLASWIQNILIWGTIKSFPSNSRFTPTMNM